MKKKRRNSSSWKGASLRALVPHGPCLPVLGPPRRGAGHQALSKYNSLANRKNWKMELIKRRDFKMIAGMKANEERYS